MKKIGTSFLLILLLSVFGATTASALRLTESTLNANCDYYEVTVKGITWTTFEADFTLDLVIVSPYGTSTVSGTFHVPFDATTIPMSFDTTYRGYWDTALCGTYTISGTVTLYPAETQYDPLVGQLAPVTVVCECGDGPGTGTPGYWKNHPDAWPEDSITIGGVTYSKDAAIKIMKKPVKGDKTFTMFDALVSAKLNVMIGNVSGCIDATIAAADAWMEEFGPVGSGVKAGGKDSPWREGEPLSQLLDAYNNGELCAPHRDAIEAEGSGKIALQAPGEFSLVHRTSRIPSTRPRQSSSHCRVNPMSA